MQFSDTKHHQVLRIEKFVREAMNFDYPKHYKMLKIEKFMRHS